MPYKDFVPGLLTNADVDQYLMSQAIITCTSTTRPVPQRVGMHIWETDMQCERVWNGTTWSFTRGVSLFVRKSSDEARVSSATLADDAALAVTVVADGTYSMEANIICQSPTAADIRITFNGPSGCFINWVPLFPHTGQTNFDQTLISMSYMIASGTADGAGFARNVVFQPRGLINSTTTSGTFKMRWCQLSSNASATTVRAGSYLYLRRIA